MTLACDSEKVTADRPSSARAVIMFWNMAVAWTRAASIAFSVAYRSSATPEISSALSMNNPPTRMVNHSLTGEWGVRKWESSHFTCGGNPDGAGRASVAGGRLVQKEVRVQHGDRLAARFLPGFHVHIGDALARLVDAGPGEGVQRPARAQIGDRHIDRPRQAGARLQDGQLGRGGHLEEGRRGPAVPRRQQRM